VAAAGSSKIKDRKELAEIAKQSYATGKMKDWEEDFEKILQTRFARLKVPEGELSPRSG